MERPDPAVAVESFPASAATLDGLGRQVLESLVAGDTAALSSFRVTEREHKDVLWPELPSSDPALNVNLDYVWLDLQARNRSAVTRALGWFGERSVRYESTECRGEIRVFESFRVRTDCWVAFESPGPGSAEPVRYEVQLFKDAIERGGGFKVFRYYDESPTPIDSAAPGP